MKRFVFTVITLLSLVSVLNASQSVVTVTEGTSCMGDDKSRKGTEQQAIKEATRQAAEYAATYVKSETHVKDSALESDLISAYANAKVTVLQELERGWYKDQLSGDCFRIRLKVEVIPDLKTITKSVANNLFDDPAALLGVRVWTDRKEYRQGDKVKVYIKANKPFYGRVVYKDASGNMVQILPNPYRTENYFNGGTVYELPGNDDRFDLEVTPPFGAEEIIVYAATAPLGEIKTVATGGVYEVKTKAQDLGSGTRGLKISAKGNNPAAKPSTAEFAEAKAELSTGR